MDYLIYGYTLEEWNSFTEDEQIYLQNKYEYIYLSELPPDGL